MLIAQVSLHSGLPSGVRRIDGFNLGCDSGLGAGKFLPSGQSLASRAGLAEPRGMVVVAEAWNGGAQLHVLASDELLSEFISVSSAETPDFRPGRNACPHHHKVCII